MEKIKREEPEEKKGGNSVFEKRKKNRKVKTGEKS